uniref:Uncharacterized protein n=1 Tax=viral metagenome TaxID=1070528 RepID=A0A6C0C1C3_9ZZZZ
MAGESVANGSWLGGEIPTSTSAGEFVADHLPPQMSSPSISRASTNLLSSYPPENTCRLTKRRPVFSGPIQRIEVPLAAMTF